MSSLILKGTKTIAVLLVLCSVFIFAPSVKAISDPPLFSCQNPVGSVIASYPDGNHGVPGRSESFTGSDIVYRIDDLYVLQCLCPSDGSIGIESNWWRIDDLSTNDIDFFVRRGWIHVLTGKAWGLDDKPYLVKNRDFACSVGGQVLGAARGQILGASTLAATGNTSMIAMMWMMGIASALIAYRLSRI